MFTFEKTKEMCVDLLDSQYMPVFSIYFFDLSKKLNIYKLKYGYIVECKSFFV